MTDTEYIQKLVDIANVGGTGLTLVLLIVFIVCVWRYITKWTPPVIKAVVDFGLQLKRQNDLIEEVTTALERNTKALEEVEDLINISEG